MFENITNQKKDRALKLTRRIRIGIKWLERYGIQRGDTALVAMTGDVRIGELGYFTTRRYEYEYNQFAFVCQQDKDCEKWRDEEWAKVEEGGICLRGDVNKCRADHEATAYGRVVAIERKRQSVETSLAFRLLDSQAEDSLPVSDVSSNALDSGNIVDLGETTEVNGKTIRLLHVKKWLREVRPQRVRFLCVGPPGDPIFAARPHVYALYSSTCGDRAMFFSLEHGGFVCKKHVTPEHLPCLNARRRD